MNRGDLPGGTDVQNVSTNGAVGATFTAFASRKGLYTKVHAPATVGIDVQVNGGGIIQVAAGGTKTFLGVQDPANLQVRRTDQSTTQVSVACETLWQSGV